MKLFLISILIAFSISINAKTYNILFIGNSYTQVNDLPNTFKQIALANGDTAVVDSYTPGGYTFNAHSTDANTLAKIMVGNWDFVVLQAQSQEPSFSPGQVMSNTYPYAKKLDSLINAYNPCAETIFYMTWGRKNGDASNCAAYPPVCTYAGMQQRLRESYVQFTQDFHATCAPAGMAWKNVIDSFSSVNLYQADESHPSIHGTYLTACVFYSTIFHKPTYANIYLPAGISNSEAFQLQQFADRTVLDSLETWQQYGDIPFADFSYTQNGDEITFVNNSKRFTNCKWYFGDGDSSTAVNPFHKYLSLNSFNVNLTVSNPCKNSTDSSSISVTSFLGLNELNKNNVVFYANNNLTVIDAKAYKQVFVYNINGQTVYTTKIQNGKDIYPIMLEKGIYIVELVGNKSRRQKIFVQ